MHGLLLVAKSFSRIKMHKYRAIPTEVDGIRFASKKEAKRYVELKLMERKTMITDLELQPKIPIQMMNTATGESKKVGTYVADFRYYCNERHKVITEDVKGFKTPLYKFKKKCVEAADDSLEVVEI